MSKKKTTEEFKKELQQIYNGSVELLSEYTGNKNKVTVRFLDCGHIEQKTPTKLLVGQGCGFCKGKAISNSKTKTTEEFKQDLLARNLNHIVLKSDYSGCKKKLKVLNTNCNHTYEAIPSNILRGIGCPICHGFKTSDTFRQQIEEKYPNEYKILGEYINNRTKILVRHKCGYEWEVIPKDLLRDIRCPRCIMSKGELFIFNYLTERKIEFTPQYSFNDCRDILPLPFDFMININAFLP